MTEIHEYKCDYCLARAPLKYNGEHWLPPIGWTNLYDFNKAEHEKIHVCPSCRPNPVGRSKDPKKGDAKK